MSEQTGKLELVQLAEQLRGSYDEFTESVQGLGSKVKGHAGNSKMAGSFIHWLAGSHVNTPRDALCEDFLTKVQSQLEFFQMALEGATSEEAAEACAVAADIMICPVDGQVNTTTGLMKRAMVSQFMPFIGYLSPEKLEECHSRMVSSYRKRDMLPVEKELIKAMEKQLKK